jgi:hypothetical protein
MRNRVYTNTCKSGASALHFRQRNVAGKGEGPCDETRWISGNFLWSGWEQEPRIRYEAVKWLRVGTKNSLWGCEVAESRNQEFVMRLWSGWEQEPRIRCYEAVKWLSVGTKNSLWGCEVAESRNQEFVMRLWSGWEQGTRTNFHSIVVSQGCTRHACKAASILIKQIWISLFRVISSHTG